MSSPLFSCVFSFRHWLFEEFLSPEECTNLIKVHKEHVKKMKEIDPIICFDSIQTLRRHLNDLQPEGGIHVTPNDFTRGTTCVNATFSSMLKQWGLRWSYSTAFYPRESPFSSILAKRIEDGTELQASHGGKFQITSTDKGVGKCWISCSVEWCSKLSLRLQGPSWLHVGRIETGSLCHGFDLLEHSSGRRRDGISG